MLLVHGPGDIVGQPYRLTKRNRRFLWRCYELNPDGSRVITRAIKGEPKGKAKTELVAVIALIEFAGPCRFGGWDENGEPLGVPQISPDIPISAASFEQADLLFGCVKTMVKEGPLVAYFDCFDTEILFKDQRPGRLYRVAAAAGTNDGLRPTFAGFDELHEFTANKERVHTVISNGVAKRADAWECIISTAGADPGVEMGQPETLLGRLYLYGKKVLAGEIQDESLLFDWLEVEGEVDLSSRDSIEQALLQVYPDGERFTPLPKLVQKVLELVAIGRGYEALRYFFNKWTTVLETWLPEGTWARLATKFFKFDRQAPTFVGVDSATKHDSHAYVFAQWHKDKLRVRAKVWERQVGQDGRPLEGWKLPIAEVENYLRKKHRELNLVAVAYDPALFERSAQQLEAERLPMIEVPQTDPRMVPACQATYELITQGRLEHDGDPVFARHIASAAAVEARNGGWRLKKAKARARMDAAIALCLAVDQAVHMANQESVYEERGLITA
jgi:phage terminase large subunit-like protein